MKNFINTFFKVYEAAYKDAENDYIPPMELTVMMDTLDDWEKAFDDDHTVILKNNNIRYHESWNKLQGYLSEEVIYLIEAYKALNPSAMLIILKDIHDESPLINFILNDDDMELSLLVETKTRYKKKCSLVT